MNQNHSPLFRRTLCAVCAFAFLLTLAGPAAYAAGEAAPAATELTRAQAAAMAQADAAMSELLDSSSYEAMSVDQRQAAAQAQLDQLASQGLVQSGSIRYDEENGMLSFTYDCGVLGGVLLTGWEEEPFVDLPLEMPAGLPGPLDAQNDVRPLGNAIIYYAFDDTVNSSRYPSYLTMQEAWNGWGLSTTLDTDARTGKEAVKMAKITINDLLEAGCHFGHQTRRWNPRMKDYVYGAKNGISIIDLTKTMYQIAAACNFLQRIVANGGDILFVGTKRQIRELVRNMAEETGMFSVSERWLGGTLTNNVTICKSITKMAEIDQTLNSESAKSMKKKEVSSLARRAEKLHRDLDGIAGMKRLPAALVVIDVCNEANAVREANKLNIPIVAIVDTNGDPTLVDYPVAANDDAVKSVQIITGLFVEAIKVAKEIYQKKVTEEREAAEAAKKLAQEKADDAEKAEKADKPRRAPRRKSADDKPVKAEAAKSEPKAEEAAAEKAE